MRSGMKINLTTTDGNGVTDRVHTKVCSQHPDKKIKFFCKVCKEFNCSNCTPNHWSHFSEQVEFGQEKLNDYSNFLVSQLEELKSSK
jgi:hypothetical protein